MTPAPGWLAQPMAALRAAHANGRMPHALLIHEAPGAGGEWLAGWAAQLVLCEKRAAAPCGACVACRRAGALAHPDLLWLRPLEESRQIRIEQVRDLSAELALTSHGGGYKVGVIAPADALNRFAANALLKTLEEPPPRTLLVLVATQPSRLPPTVISRCQRLRVRAPAREQAVAWLSAARGAADWDAALEVLGEAPMLAAQADPKEVAEIGADTRRTLDALAGGSADPVAAAERWARADFPLRLLCFEKWLTERMRPAGAQCSDPRGMFALVDEVRDLRANLDAPLNRGLALEALFRRLAPAAPVRGSAAPG